MSETIESRLARVERELEALKSRMAHGNPDWISEITGKFKGDTDFDEIVRLGKELRDAEQPEED
jgi:hypothetical protein